MGFLRKHNYTRQGANFAIFLNLYPPASRQAGILSYLMGIYGCFKAKNSAIIAIFIIPYPSTSPPGTWAFTGMFPFCHCDPLANGVQSQRIGNRPACSIPVSGIASYLAMTKFVTWINMGISFSRHSFSEGWQRTISTSEIIQKSVKSPYTKIRKIDGKTFQNLYVVGRDL